MDTTQTLALLIAGLVLPFVQEKLVGAKVTGATAVWVNVLASVVIAVAATGMTSGFADVAKDPTLLALKIGAVFALAQLVYNSAPATVARVAGTAPAPPAP